jgi:hypothetical protein
VRQPDSPAMVRVENALESENYAETYRIIAEWIRFADAKAGVTLTVNGILLGLLLPQLKTYLDTKAAHPTAWWTSMVVVLFLGWLLPLALSAVCAFLCILPIRGSGRGLALKHTQHFHPVAVTQSYRLTDVERFVQDYERLGTDGLRREIITAILIDSHLSDSKYGHVKRAIWLLGISFAFAFLYLVAIQF